MGRPFGPNKCEAAKLSKLGRYIFVRDKHTICHYQYHLLGDVKFLRHPNAQPTHSSEVSAMTMKGKADLSGWIDVGAARCSGVDEGRSAVQQ